MKVLAPALFVLACALAGCPSNVRVTPLGSSVSPADVPRAEPTPGVERLLEPKLPGGWRLSGGPADFTADTAGEVLGEEIGRFRGLKSFAAAEYANHARRVIALEVFLLSSAESARTALELGNPEGSRPLSGDDLDAGFIAGLRAEAHKGPLLVRVRWFENEDEVLEDAAIEAMRDVLALGWKSDLTSTPADGPPVPAATAATAAEPDAEPTPAASPDPDPTP